MKRTPKQLYALAKAHKMIMWSILIDFVLTVLFAFLSSIPHSDAPYAPLLVQAMRAALLCLSFVFVAIAPVNMYRLTKELGSRVPWLWAPLALIPLVNFFALALLTSDATKVLRMYGYNVGFMGVNLKNIATADVLSEVRWRTMDIKHLKSIIDELGSKVVGGESAWQFTFQKVEVTCFADREHDRMRIAAAIIRLEDMAPEQAVEAFDANFDSALEARYATNDGVLYSVFIHPLSTLTDGEVRSAVEQVVSLAQTFGTTYRSGRLTFGQ